MLPKQDRPAIPARFSVKHSLSPLATQPIQETVWTIFRPLTSSLKFAFPKKQQNVAFVWAVASITRPTCVQMWVWVYTHSVSRPLKAKGQDVFGDYPSNLWGKCEHWIAINTAFFPAPVYLKSLITFSFKYSYINVTYLLCRQILRHVIYYFYFQVF